VCAGLGPVVQAAGAAQQPTLDVCATLVCSPEPNAKPCMVARLPVNNLRHTQPRRQHQWAHTCSSPHWRQHTTCVTWLCCVAHSLPHSLTP
jgi:hypothetical protein